jgi:hypothetical protein
MYNAVSQFDILLQYFTLAVYDIRRYSIYIGYACDQILAVIGDRREFAIIEIVGVNLFSKQVKLQNVLQLLFGE